jgi:CO/xanthine dehydrogenase Mo-binding subunit
VVGTSACYEAAARIGERMKRIAAGFLDEPTSAIEFEADALRSRKTGESLTFEEVAHAAYNLPHRLPEGMDPGLDLTHYYTAPNIDYDLEGTGRASSFSAHPYTADVAVVEIDTETGLFEILEYATVHDCGTILNPKIVEGQHMGALAHGFGGAMLETLPYDDSGNPAHQTFVDYAIPSATEIPDLTMDHLETPSPFTPGGHKGSGETGTVSVPPALTNAVEDALRPFGVRIREPTPMTPAFIWEKIRAATGGGTAAEE